MSQFTEVRDDRDGLDRDVATLTEQVQALRLAVSEKDGLAREDARRMDALRADTADRGSRLRQCELRNGELEKLNALLTAELDQNRTASGAEQSALLEELHGRGYSRADLEALAGGNFLRVLRAVEGAAS